MPNDKHLQVQEEKVYEFLTPSSKHLLKNLIEESTLSFSQLRSIMIWMRDLEQWNKQEEIENWITYPRIQDKRKQLQWFEKKYHEIQSSRSYTEQVKPNHEFQKTSIFREKKKGSILGKCPVASEKTRCCNLLTLDAVDGCGFDCLYCSIQSFYRQGKVIFKEDLEEKLHEINLDPKQFYHIGTGQSSDSLLWGDSQGILSTLFRWARENPNVILELKSKSHQIKSALALNPPRNVLFTWSLNPPNVIVSEEKGTSSLESRIQAARMASDKGYKVGFHFHPMFHYEEWQKDYLKITGRLLSTFQPEEIVAISMGSLTFTVKVMNQIRSRRISTKVLQTPMIKSNGKYSPPNELKVSLFSWLYNELEPWHGEVFFYLCMEDITLWKPVFGFEYNDNEAFEKKMIDHYRNKMKLALS